MINWLRRALRIPEPVAQAAVVELRGPKRPANVQTPYRYTTNSLSFCRVLRLLAISQTPLTMKEISALMDVRTVPLIIAQMRRDGLIHSERRTIGSAVFSHTLTPAGRELAASEGKP